MMLANSTHTVHLPTLMDTLVWLEQDQVAPSVEDVEDTVFLVIFLATIGLVFLASTVVNVSLLLVFVRKASLRTTSNRFVINLLVANMVSVVVLLPLVALDRVAPLSLHQCLLSMGVSQGVASLSLLSTLLVGWDQYLAVLRPLRYHHHMTRTIATILITTVWITTILTASSTSLLPTSSPLWRCCPSPSYPLPPLTLFLSLLLLLLTFFLPALCLVVIYLRIYSEAHTSSERTRRNSLNPASSENIYNIANMAVVPLSLCQDKQRASLLSSPSLRSSLSRSFRHRVSNASQLMRREEGKTARVYLASISSILLCWGPLYTSSSLPGVPPLPPWCPPLILLLALLYSLISPFLFAWRHRKIRVEVCRLYSLQLPPPLHHLPPPRPLRESRVRSAHLEVEVGRRPTEEEVLLRSLSTISTSTASSASIYIEDRLASRLEAAC